MFCIQCEQTLSNERTVGCQFRKGMCGKEAETAGLQDLLIYALQGLGQVAHRARQTGIVDEVADRFVPFALFTTLTNVNFDAERFAELVPLAVSHRQRLEQACAEQGVSLADVDEAARFVAATDREGMQAQSELGSLTQWSDPDLRGLRLLILYGLKGCGAYCDHAMVLGKTDPAIFAEFHRILDILASDESDIERLLAVSMEVGQLNLKIMALLDAANTENFGHPEPTSVRTTPVRGHCILVSGHDMGDLKAILEQTQGTGINVYTHGELLPAHGYPELKRYPHLVGNYGGAWQDQQEEFARFPGAIVMTSNCLLDPNTQGYANRIFTSGPVGWPGIPHIENRDFSSAILCAQALPGFAEDQIEQNVMVGFARNTLMSVAGTVVDAVKSGALKHFFLIGGCDGAKSGRNYYTEFAEAVPQDSVILTLGCNKYRFNDRIHGDIGGIPRLIDVGQCNDAYSALQIALALAEAFECGVNDLPLSLIISWFEQKAAAVLLTLLSLGVKGIHLGPTLPAYLTPNLLQVLVERFELKPIGEASADLAACLAA